MPRRFGTSALKAMDLAVCKTAALTFNTIQFFNKRNPNPSFTPKWSDKPLLKSWEKTKPTIGVSARDRLAVPRLREGCAAKRS